MALVNFKNKNASYAKLYLSDRKAFGEPQPLTNSNFKFAKVAT